MLERRSLLPKIGRGLLRVSDPVAHGLIVRELDTWVRLEFLGVMARSGVADALKEPATLEDVTDRTGIQDQQLLEALLALGLSLRELRIRRGRYSIRGRRMRAIVGSSPDLRGVVEELVVYDNAVYSGLMSHLHGAPPAPYDAGFGDVIAAASRIAEPILGPAVRELANHIGPKRVLDIGCGSGVYLRHALEAATAATGLGIDLDGAAVAAAVRHLGDLGSASRCEVRQGDIDELAQGVGQFDLVMLLNNIYYWAPDERRRTAAHRP